MFVLSRCLNGEDYCAHTNVGLPYRGMFFLCCRWLKLDDSFSFRKALFNKLINPLSRTKALRKNDGRILDWFLWHHT